MKWINAKQQVTVTIYDEEHEEHLDKIMTVEEMLDTYTNEGCPTMYSNPKRKKVKWINDQCSNCGYSVYPWNNTPYCPNCGAKMIGDEKDE